MVEALILLAQIVFGVVMVCFGVFVVTCTAVFVRYVRGWED